MLLTNALILLGEIKKSGYKANDWELTFIQSILNSNRRTLSYKQSKALEAIYAKAYRGGIYEKKERI